MNTPNYFMPTGMFNVYTAPESFRLFRTYHKSETKPAKPKNTSGTDNGWSPNNTDGAVWMCEKSAVSINEGEWGDIIRIKGEDGLPGPMGERGQLPYPAGMWNNTTAYKCTTKTAAFVWYEAGKTYYVLNKEGSFKGINPATDYAANGLNATWIPFENFKAIYAELLFARFGLLGSAVFYDDYMFSQHGVDANDNQTSDYSGFPNTFTPNILLDLKKGSGHLAAGNIEWDKYGYLYQKSRSRIIWRKLQNEMIESNNTTNYPINLIKGTYLDINCGSGPFTAVLPDPATVQNAIIDTTYMFTTRSSYSVKLKCPGKLYMIANGVKTYPTGVEGFHISPFTPTSGVITSLQSPDTGGWEWFADGEGLIGSK